MQKSQIVAGIDFTLFLEIDFELSGSQPYNFSTLETLVSHT